MRLGMHHPTIKQQVDDALREERDVSRDHLLVVMSPSAYEHIRSYVRYETYRGAMVRIDHSQLEDWVIRPVPRD